MQTLLVTCSKVRDKECDLRLRNRAETHFNRLIAPVDTKGNLYKLLYLTIKSQTLNKLF